MVNVVCTRISDSSKATWLTLVLRRLERSEPHTDSAHLHTEPVGGKTEGSVSRISFLFRVWPGPGLQNRVQL